MVCLFPQKDATIEETVSISTKLVKKVVVVGVPSVGKTTIIR